MFYVWLIFQGLVAFAVLSANIYWQITPNGVVAGAAALAAAYLATLLVNWLAQRLRRGRQQQLSRQ